MMIDLSKNFETIYLLLKKNRSLPFVEEIVNSIETANVIYNPISKISTKDVYKHQWGQARFQIDMLDEILVFGYEKVLSNLDSEKDENISISHIISDNSDYIIYTNLEINRIIGILRATAGNISKTLSIQKENSAKGFGSNIYRFSKLKLVEKFQDEL